MGEGECMGGAGSEGGRADADEFMEGREIAGDPILVPFPMTFAGALLFFFQLFSHAMSAGCHVLQGLSSWVWVHSFPFFSRLDIQPPPARLSKNWSAGLASRIAEAP